MNCKCGCGQDAGIGIYGEPNQWLRGHWNKGKRRESVDAKWHLDPDTGCWVWQRATLHGYGYVKDLDKGQNVRAHRFFYERAKGPIPSGLQLDHLCRNKACVNPDHLEAVTPRVNTLRSTGITAANARKTHCPKGHPLSGENLYESNGRRHCRQCRRDTKRRRRLAGKRD